MVMPTLDKIIVTVNSELLISSLIIGNSMERILHAPYHSWVPQAWVTCYFAHEWNKMQIILPAIRGIVLIEGVCMAMRRLRVCSHFCKCYKNALLIHNSDLPHHLSLVWVGALWKLSFVSTQVRWKWAGEKGKRTFGASHQQIHKSASPAFWRFCLPPLCPQRQTMEYLCCFFSLFPILVCQHRKALPLWHICPARNK